MHCRSWRQRRIRSARRCDPSARTEHEHRGLLPRSVRASASVVAARTGELFFSFFGRRADHFAQSIGFAETRSPNPSSTARAALDPRPCHRVTSDSKNQRRAGSRTASRAGAFRTCGRRPRVTSTLRVSQLDAGITASDSRQRGVPRTAFERDIPSASSRTSQSNYARQAFRRP